ncbi:MAG: TRAP transporter small permease subunit [Desulfobacterales bacterium]|nr:TRAP transporter small permease subunit [Desulfobacterales bacterium]
MLDTIATHLEGLVRREGEISSLLVYPLLFIVVYEVFMRYVFNAPTSWGFEATTFLYGIHFMLGTAYTDVHRGHVRVDIFTAMATPRTQTILAIVTNLIFFMPVMTCMVIWSIKFSLVSMAGLEVNSTSWAPPIWPLKIIMALCFVFLWLQGIANLCRDLYSLNA